MKRPVLHLLLILLVAGSYFLAGCASHKHRPHPAIIKRRPGEDPDDYAARVEEIQTARAEKAAARVEARAQAE